MSDESAIPNAYICGIGMITAVGDSAHMTAASVRAGINRYKESRYSNKHNNPMKLALVPDSALPLLNAQLQAANLTARQNRMLRLAHCALTEALADLPQGIAVPLLLAGPEKTPGTLSPITPGFLDHLIAQSGAIIDRDQSNVYTTGRAGGLIALEAAMIKLAHGSCDYVLVGGVDSCVDTLLLSIWDKDNRVLAEDVLDGFAPGEGAGFLLLASEEMMRETNGHGKFPITVSAPGLGTEMGHRYNENVACTGDGLAEAFSRALDNSGIDRVNTIYASLNGESFGGKEYGVARIRNSDRISPDAATHHPAQCYGDIGAATAPLLIGLAAIGILKHYVLAPVLVYSSSEFEYRGACCVNIIDQL